MYFMVDSSINEDPVQKEHKFHNPHDMKKPQKSDFSEDDLIDKKMQEN
tara:strand:- start:757 stop:900 length:144 start_codon:yes stop_codon:yes gene_type:complete